ncbi:surface lipoprotein assembly modifier [Microbulbifer spongiae]|uniref:Surface lipoprotein assembly modifier n=1 Tax=Microbulbifer spongiae TaxID=2944933 RepID=A0ABY9EAZ7_9GAMM|nr:surface lipoprotein assembly modifier [Microbulbifer sp. MI-G]WKD49487.1 surface lipoprotein assembly modifier [Microbulbifer sp. MI-G]
MLLFFFTMPSVNADEDTELRLRQRNVLTEQRREASLLEAPGEEKESQEREEAGRGIEPVGNTVQQLGYALYRSLQQRQWDAVDHLLQRYLALPDHDRMLVYYARGALARRQGDFIQAEAEYRALLSLQPEFLPGQLELARVLFENHKNDDAIRLFRHIEKTIPEAETMAQGVRNKVSLFIRALEDRDSWRGSMAIGPSYIDNLNQSSKSYRCFLRAPDNSCLIDRRAPEAISANGVSFDAALDRHFSFNSHHGLQLNTLLYGKNYSAHQAFNESTVAIKWGYSYRSAANQYLAAPMYEYRTLGDNTLYSAWGGNLQWTHHFSSKTALKLETSFREEEYEKDVYAFESGGRASIYATAWHQPFDQWLLFAGLDYISKQTAKPVNARVSRGLRFGASQTLQWGVEITLFCAFRERKYGAFSKSFGTRRMDREQNYNLLIRVPGVDFYGLAPGISLQYSRVKSNVDWLYSYEKASVDIVLEKRF